MKKWNGAGVGIAVLVVGIGSALGQAKSGSSQSQNSTDATSPAATTNDTATAYVPGGKGAMPSGAKGVCKDGTYVVSGTRSGACKAHRGVKTWFAEN